MYYRSHKWVDIPLTKYEIRRELNVRESCHTAMIWDRRYQDIDTGKFDSDRLKTINTCSLVHAIEDSSDYKNGRFDYPLMVEDSYNVVKIRRAQEGKELQVQKEIERKRLIKEQQIIKRDKERLEYLKRKKEEKEKEANYRYYLKCREQELLMEKMSKVVKEEPSPLIYLGGPDHDLRACNIRPNNWIKK